MKGLVSELQFHSVQVQLLTSEPTRSHCRRSGCVRNRRNSRFPTIVITIARPNVDAATLEHLTEYKSEDGRWAEDLEALEQTTKGGLVPATSSTGHNPQATGRMKFEVKTHLNIVAERETMWLLGTEEIAGGVHLEKHWRETIASLLGLTPHTRALSYRRASPFDISHVSTETGKDGKEAGERGRAQ